ncbi:MAG: response regulator [Candidatus Omnitrophica bacterium]|nr:response regulator [Candidatus Omnitrophota bacterium]MDD4941302.1 response regulator [Candidatus Omnitrophota bacterium]MDD5774872.1 response regulator [Candidatus Omnitrophota bacterium]HNQ49836.1 response regulator [Candidatus Omnitrophota bacterium]HQO38801.1 response regulator [Candidatus Omnitrophota bacterium]
MAEIQKRILIIDDEADICDFSKRILERTGNYEVFTTQDSQDGIFIAKDKKPDLILLDINMPKLDGGEVAQTLSEFSTTRSIPIVFITALMKKEELDQEGKVNKYFFLPKPISPEELVGKVGQILAMK